MRKLFAYIVKYQKALHTSLLVGGTNFWVTLVFLTLAAQVHDRDNSEKDFSKEILTVSYYFPNTLLLLPLLSGILTDQVGPLSIFKYLNVTLIIGILIFI